MRFKFQKKKLKDKLKYYKNPHKWFAWKLVHIGNNDYVIFETVYRQYPNAEIINSQELFSIYYANYRDFIKPNYVIMYGTPQYTLIKKR